VAETLVVGDVHGCRRELEKLAAKAGVDRVVLVGDLFLKGPDPRGVYDLVRESGWEAVLGNHDLRLLHFLEGRRRRDTEARACARALDKGGKAWRKWLKKLPLFVKVRPFTVVHAGLHPRWDNPEAKARPLETLPAIAVKPASSGTFGVSVEPDAASTITPSSTAPPAGESSSLGRTDKV